MTRLARALGTGGMAAILLCSPLAALAEEDGAVCGIETARQERLQAIPERLLHSISLVESGRWDARRRAVSAWPWTVTAEGEGQYLPNKAAAIAEVRRLRAGGVRNIDVGCMQINLQAHPDAFASLDDAFDPATNVAYAARFLVGLYGDAQDWPTAGAHYHSQTPDLAAEYKAKLLTVWTGAKGQGGPPTQLASAEPAPINRPPVGLVWAQAAVPSAALPFVDQGQRIVKAKADAESRSIAEKAEAKRLADAYRQAKLEEYRQRKAQHG